MNEASVKRICPICDRLTSGRQCQYDGYETVDRETFEVRRTTDPLIGMTLGGKYRVEKYIGGGGNGTVYLGINLTLGHPVAVKVLSRDLMFEESALRRFRQEAESTSKLTHPNIVRVFDFSSQSDRFPYLVMEYVKGLPLNRVIEETGPVDPGRVLTMTRQVLGALSEAHGHGVIHRDLKPHNILLTTAPGVGDFVRVVDFGIAKVIEHTEGLMLDERSTVVGTPHYMAPEQASGDPVDGRTDLYSLGVTIYETLAGRPPFDGNTVLAILMAHRNQPVPPLPEKVTCRTPSELTRLLFRLLEKQPERRPSTAHEALKALPVLSDEIPSQRPLQPPARGGSPAPTERIPLAEAFVTVTGGGGEQPGPKRELQSVVVASRTTDTSPRAGVTRPGRNAIAVVAVLAMVTGALAFYLWHGGGTAEVETGGAEYGLQPEDPGPGTAAVDDLGAHVPAAGEADFSPAGQPPAEVVAGTHGRDVSSPAAVRRHLPAKRHLKTGTAREPRVERQPEKAARPRPPIFD